MVAQELQRKTRRVIGLQLSIGVLVAAGFLLGKSLGDAQSALYGALISVVSAWWLGRGVSRASEQTRQGGRGEAVLYVGAALRFLMVLVMFVIGLVYIRLAPAPMVTGFVLAQLAFAMAAPQIKKGKNKHRERES